MLLIVKHLSKKKKKKSMFFIVKYIVNVFIFRWSVFYQIHQNQKIQEIVQETNFLFYDEPTIWPPGATMGGQMRIPCKIPYFYVYFQRRFFLLTDFLHILDNAIMR